ncbi:MAG: HPF/RaiA family ribosome-associated protein [Comamonadaceae bacterium]|nr:HPF/RaiA family ribosome-associated protein [Comamonadaceae bacterium]
MQINRQRSARSKSPNPCATTSTKSSSRIQKHFDRVTNANVVLTTRKKNRHAAEATINAKGAQSACRLRRATTCTPSSMRWPTSSTARSSSTRKRPAPTAEPAPFAAPAARLRARRRAHPPRSHAPPTGRVRRRRRDRDPDNMQSRQRVTGRQLKRPRPGAASIAPPA